MAKRIVWIDQAKADIIGIQQPIAIQIFKTLGRYVLTGEGATKQLKGVTPPMIRLRAQDHRVYGQVFRLWPTRAESDRIRTGFRGEAEHDSGMIPNSIPG